MNSQAMAHKMFHDPDGRGEYAGCPLKYSNWGGLHAISYSTTIARVVTTPSGEQITLLSAHKYSNTTARHLSDIYHASPYRVIEIPNCQYEPRLVFMSAFDKYDKPNDWDAVEPKDFNHTANRQELLSMLAMFDEYQRIVGGLDDLLPRRQAGIISVYEQLCHDINGKRNRKQAFAEADEQYATAKKEQQRRQRKLEGIAKRKATLQRKKVNAYINQEGNLSERLQTIFYDSKYNRLLKPLTQKQKLFYNDCRVALSQQFNTKIGYRTASYFWYDKDEDCIRTSQGIECTTSSVKRLLSMWLRHENIIGEKTDGYTIVQHTDDYVQIGCHTIPTWNIKAMCNELIPA